MGLRENIIYIGNLNRIDEMKSVEFSNQLIASVFREHKIQVEEIHIEAISESRAELSSKALPKRFVKKVIKAVANFKESLVADELAVAELEEELEAVEKRRNKPD